jgi:MFS family permease
VVCAVAWVFVELRSSSPLIDMRTMRIPAVWTTNIVAVLVGAGMYAMMTFLPQLLQTPKALAGYGLSASITMSGLYMLPLSVAMFLVGFAIGPLAARIGSKIIVLAGGVVSAVGFVILAIGHDQSWEIYTAAVLLGLGIGMSFSSMPAIIVGAVPPAQTGAATGMNANVRTVGGAIGSAVSSVILTSGTHAAHGFPSNSGYTGVFWFLTGISVLAVVASIIIPSGRARRGQATEVVVEALAVPDSIPVQEFALAVPAANGFATNGSAAVARSVASASGPSIQGRVGRDGGGSVVGAVLTLIDQRGQQVSRASGTPDGDFGIDAPSQGSYVLIASAPGHRPAAVSVLVGAHPQRVEVTLPTSGELSGTVRRAGGGSPVPGATVTLTNTRGEVVGAAVTGEDGGYACGVTPGVHTVVAVAATMRPAASTLTVPESGVLRHDIDLEPTAVLAGVVQAGDRALSDAQVSVLDAAGELVAVARTDENGQYLVPDLPEGRYAVVTRGYPPATSTVTVAGSRITHDVELGYHDERAPLPVR